MSWTLKSIWPAAAFIIWVAAIFTFSSESYHDQTIIPFLQRHWTAQQLIQILPDVQITYYGHLYSAHHDPYHFVEFVFRKCSHLFMYAGLGGIVLLLFGRLTAKRPAQVFLAVVIAAFLASCDEWNQSGSAGRTSTFEDLMLDTASAIIGMILFLLFFIRDPKNKANLARNSYDK